MALDSTPTAERLRIGFFGVRNAGKSSLVNAVTNQDVSVVSASAGTTTDAVSKSMELLPLGPVVIVDTPGIDDEGPLGSLRVERTRKALRQCDIAVLVRPVTRPACAAERDLVEEFVARGLPWVVALSKADLLESGGADCAGVGETVEPGAQAVEPGVQVVEPGAQAVEPGAQDASPCATVLVSAASGQGLEELKAALGSCAGRVPDRRVMLRDLISPGQTVVLVVPIDGSAPKGRLILPQQLALREVLDAHATAVCCQPQELAAVLDTLRVAPSLVVTDSQVFSQVAPVVPQDVRLTSFSILMARYKGVLDQWTRGAQVIAQLRDGDRVLIAEGCTHRRQCDDIGTVKMPRWIRAACAANPEFQFTSGGGFPEDLSPYRLIVHCGGCMLNNREMAHRMELAKRAGVPVVNYGVAIAQMHGILERCLWL